MSRTHIGFSFITLLSLGSATLAADGDRPVSFEKQIKPILTAACVSCHSPEKEKGGLDLTSFKALSAGGKEGLILMPGHPDKSAIVISISGPEAAMPEKGDKLTQAEVDLIARWIREGAKDDSTTVATMPGQAEIGPTPLDKPPVYPALPVVSAMAYSPDGRFLAVSGYHEVLLHKVDGSAIVGRLVGGSPRIESLAFSTDSKMLAVSGGAPAQFGNIQVWTLADRKLVKNFKYTRDTLFGVSFSPDHQRLAFGCVDKSARVVTLSTGQEVLKLDQHSDWCLATAFNADGSRILTGGRDMAIKMSLVSNGQFIDDINNPLEPVLAMVKHPKEEMMLCGGGSGTPRIYKISDNQNRTAGRNDTNLVRAFERQPSAAHAVAYSPDGQRIAVGSLNEARVYSVKDGKRLATLPGHDGAIFAVAFSPDGTQLATGGHDGMVRLFDAAKGTLIKAFPSAPVQK